MDIKAANLGVLDTENLSGGNRIDVCLLDTEGVVAVDQAAKNVK